MKQATKQRIVGSVVLLCLALIFLPILFDGDGSYQTTLSSRIPDPPEVTTLPVPQQTRPEILSDAEPEPGQDSGTPAAAPEVADSTADTAEEGDSTESADLVEIVESEPAFVRDPLPLADDGLPEGWTVRLGAFSESANAISLMQRLQNAGYKAYTRERSSTQGDLTIVYVGPWLDRDRAETYLSLLQDEFRLTGLIERYEMRQL